MIKTRTLALLLIAASLSLAACKEEGPMEKAGKKMDEMAEDAEKAAKEAAEEVEEAVEGD